MRMGPIRILSLAGLRLARSRNACCSSNGFAKPWRMGLINVCKRFVKPLSGGTKRFCLSFVGLCVTATVGLLKQQRKQSVPSAARLGGRAISPLDRPAMWRVCGK